jgi:hypothetical protein
VYERANLAVKLIQINLIGYPIQFRVGQEKESWNKEKDIFYIVKNVFGQHIQAKGSQKHGGDHHAAEARGPVWWGSISYSNPILLFYLKIF